LSQIVASVNIGRPVDKTIVLYVRIYTLDQHCSVRCDIYVAGSRYNTRNLSQRSGT